MLHDDLYLTRQFEIPELMDQPCSYQEMHGCLRDLASVNHCTFAYRPTLRWLDRIVAQRGERPLRLLDVGCGYGDMLRKIERWSRRRKLPVELTGVDINPKAISVAQQATAREHNIRFFTSDPFSYTGEADVIISSLFTHHLSNEDVSRFLAWMEERAAIGWFVNDLHRHPIPFRLFRLMAKLAAWHPFVQHDGPISVLRAFTREDWHHRCNEAGLASGGVEVQWHMPFRLCVSRIR